MDSFPIDLLRFCSCFIEGAQHETFTTCKVLFFVKLNERERERERPKALRAHELVPYDIVERRTRMLNVWKVKSAIRSLWSDYAFSPSYVYTNDASFAWTTFKSLSL